MKCPLCKVDSLTPITLINGLAAQQCQKCAGIWVASLSYFAWLKAQKTAFPDQALQPGEALPGTEPPQAKICPDCGHLLRRYKIWPNIAFYLDHCVNCNGIWFDREEWQVIEKHNLHDNLNVFFTQVWQHHLQALEQHAAIEQIYLGKLGAEDYQEIRRVREWIWQHPQRGMLLAFLQADDPFKD